MSIQRFDRATLAASPWKNGGGTTREIASWPPGAGMDDFQWRLSIATIGANGPFSAFPGVDRIITLLDGPGVRLVTNDGTIDHVLNRPLEPFSFPGEAAVYSTVLGDACSDFNVMTRRTQLRAQLRVLGSAASIDAAEHGMLLAVRGSWHAYAARSGVEHRLEPGQGGWWADESQAWRLAPACTDAALIAVRIHAAVSP
ncbi:MAG: HutD/Ves family protein [Bordetella sp.]|uniref:HutD/Ves family protein n=1 Tax=Bordetella sp. TaxID=28081 RepID=UPI003F7BC67D